MPQPIRFQAEIASVTRHGPDVATFTMISDKRLPRIRPGQFVHLAVDEADPAGFWPESRPFSVANAVDDRRTVILTISRQGNYTSRILDEARVGGTVWGKGPYGDFTVGDARSRVVMVAGGTGITPFCAFMDQVIRSGRLPVESAALHYGARSPDLLIYRDLAERCVAALPGFDTFYYVEEGSLSGLPRDRARSGRIDVDSLASSEAGCRDAAFYLSGPRAMIRQFESALTGPHGVSQERVLVDAWD